MLKSSMVVGIALASLTLVGCSSDKVAPRAPAFTQTSALSPDRRFLTADQERAVDQARDETGDTGLSIDDAILRMCPEVQPPRFDFDSSKVKTQFRDTLVSLAECMLRGGLHDRDVLLVGHADPRGEEDYNMALGGRRADSVRLALEALGVQQRRLDVSSRGALDALGSEEVTWSKDRRVDIKLKVN